ncbi:glycosyltransferase [Fischerella thermalis]|uniref:glycosyltransferase n=1 Tax=Fischerella thermalis TaxID=372787 RepID=UPI0019E29B30|nr:glycosyltransferase [Fischerella thermalis]MBF2061042.1 glycosyltransferase [Fischerella thermalis M66_A2018_004]MBF2069118.1 glycosyltransferase [Fischerella thermalis M48_A2018_028]
MTVVNRIKFTSTSETSSLYIKCSGGAYLNSCTEHQEIVFTQNSVLSFNTYFNSFFEKFYAKYTQISSLYYLLTLEGNFQIALYREYAHQETRELIHTESFDKCQLSEPVKISLPDSWQSEDAGRVYLEITCLGEHGLFTEGVIATDQPKSKEVSLGIVICTFKKETYVKNTVNTILKDSLLQSKNFKVFVVDNGSTLKKDEFDSRKVQLIPNRNLGGAGGFTRGLIQALHENYTHFLLMDDDVELDSESIYRLFPLYEYATQDFAISGAMLDLYKKCIVHEAGGLSGVNLGTNKSSVASPFGHISLKHNINLEKNSINLFLSEESPDYGAFWFFSFPKQIVEKIGLPMPYFIRGDDMEFGLRIKKIIGNSIIAFPGIAIWHEPFYTKNHTWVTYYIIRNQLVTHSLHSSLQYLEAVNFITRILLHKLFIFDYNSAEMVIKGFEDYIKGPKIIKNSDPENLHKNIVELSKKYKNQTIESGDNQIYKQPKQQKNNVNFYQQLFRLLTLNGHLYPNSLISNQDALLWIGSDYTDRWDKAFAKQRVIIVREGNNSIEKNELSHATGIRVFMRWLQTIIKSYLKWHFIQAEWRSSFQDLTSIEFWQEYLKLNETKLHS